MTHSDDNLLPMSGGGSRGPWGQGPSGGNNGGRNGSGGNGGGGGNRRRPGQEDGPDLDEIIRKGQEKIREIFPGNSGNKQGVILLLLAALVLWLASGIYIVDTDEQGIVMRFGAYNDTTDPGLQYHWPVPIERVITMPVTRVNSEEIGFRSLTGRTGESAQRPVPAESLMLTGDENIVDIQFVVQWKVSEAQKLLFNIRTDLIEVSGTPYNIKGPAETVRSAAESAMREIIGKTPIAEANSQRRQAIEMETKDLLQNILESYNAGIQIVNVNVQKVEPPEDVVPAFKDVQSARADKERTINEAEAYRNEIIPRARGQAVQVTQKAESYKAKVTNHAQGEAERFIAIHDEYKGAKDITKKRLYIETMETVMQDMNKVVIDSDVKGVMPFLPLPELQKRAAERSAQ